MTTRQKITMALLLIVIILIIWQLFSLFHENNATSSNHAVMANNKKMSGTNTTPTEPHVPQPAPLPKPPVVSEQEKELIKLQKQTEEKYINALSQLQMLKVERDIAETNKAIVTAKLDTATAEKNMANLLQPNISSASYAQGLANPSSIPPSTPSLPPANNSSATAQNSAPTVTNNYLVISVSLLQGKWNAVLGSQGKLYQVYIGDILPDDKAQVVDIDKSGVTLKYGDEKRKISLVPII
jgi:type IV pilus biogenesis protein PilP